METYVFIIKLSLCAIGGGLAAYGMIKFCVDNDHWLK